MLTELWWRLLRLGFRLLYNELAWTYDLVSWVVSLGEWRAWQRAALPFLQGPRVLEIAHGPGHMLLALDAAGYQVLGLDLSPAMGRQARRRLRRAGVRVPLLRAQVQALPLAGAAFDSVLSTFPTDFVAEPATLAAVYRVLRPGGVFVVVPEGHLTGRGVTARFLAWLFTITGQRPGRGAVGDEAWLAHSPAWALLGRRLTAAGFAVQLRAVQLPRSGVTVILARKVADEAIFADPAGFVL